MIRRVPLLVAGVAAAAVLSSCSTFDTSAAARVDGEAIDERVVQTLLAGPEDVADATVSRTALDGTQARLALSQLILARIAEQIADRYGLDLSKARAADQAATKENLTGERLTRWTALSDDERNLISDFQVAVETLKSVPGNAPANLEQRYRNPESTGYFCIRYVAFQTEAEAVAALSRIRGGEKFASVADGFNEEKNGGIAGGPDGSPCVALDQFRPPNLPAPLADALYAATPGETTDPVQVLGESGSAWFLLLHRPWSEIGTDLATKVAEAPAFAEYLAAVAVSRAEVASRYGTWDAISASLVQHS